MPCDQRRELELESERKRRRAAKKRREKEKARKEKEAKEAKERVEAARAAIRDQAKKMGWKLTEESLNHFIASKPYSNDKIKFEVTKTGIVKTLTDKISMVNHSNAEAFLRNVATVLKGTWKIFHRTPGMAADAAKHAAMHAAGVPHEHQP
jgi:uncharacterized protein YpuA (DUF1002 family)